MLNASPMSTSIIFGLYYRLTDTNIEFLLPPASLFNRTNTTAAP
jgi:hypothetical protein